MCDIDYSPLAIVNKETFSAYRSKIETCVSDKGWLVSLIKLEKEKSERFGYGLEQTVAFYEEALPPIVKLLTRFNDLERRLTILNKPLDIMLKNEILIRTGVISRDINEKWRLPETQSAAATEQDNIDTVEENEGIKEEIALQGLDLIGVIPQDETIYEYDSAGKPTSKVDANNPVRLKVAEIMKELGF